MYSYLISSQVPSPALIGGADEALVADGVQGGVRGSDADDGVRAALARRPHHLPAVQPARVAHAAADAVRALRHRMAVERQSVLLLHEDVQRSENTSHLHVSINIK